MRKRVPAISGEKYGRKKAKFKQCDAMQSRRVHVAVNPTVPRETTPKHEIMLAKFSAVGLQSFCFKDPESCLRETVCTRACAPGSASLRLVSKGTKGALFRGM